MLLSANNGASSSAQPPQPQPATSMTPIPPPAEGQPTPPDETNPLEKLRRYALEIESVLVRAPASTTASSSSASGSLTSATDQPSTILTYRPTYRAVLAKRGYLVQNDLGSGSYSKVKKVYYFAKRSLIQVMAVKIIDRAKAPQDYQEKFLPRELKHWPRLHHPNLIALNDCFQDNQRVYMILEYAEGGDALKHIQATGAIREDRARVWTAQITSAVRYMHDIDIAHRDLKLENLLIDANDNMKLCDFGFVREALSGDLSQTYCGSKSYAAPEILQGRPYDPKKADVWAIGVILYIFVTGKMPFDETKGTKSILEEQRALDFRWSRARPLTTACQCLVRRMFTWPFPDRPDVNSILADPWFLPVAATDSSIRRDVNAARHHAASHRAASATAAACSPAPPASTRRSLPGIFEPLGSNAAVPSNGRAPHVATGDSKAVGSDGVRTTNL